MSHNSSSLADGGIDNSKQMTEGENGAASNNTLYHSCDYNDFAEQGEVIEFNKIRVVKASNSNEFEDFECFNQLRQSDWSVNWPGVAQLNDGTMLFEGHQ